MHSTQSFEAYQNHQSFEAYQNHHYLITATGSKENPYLNTLQKITRNFLNEKAIDCDYRLRKTGGWCFEVNDLTSAMQVTAYLMFQQTFLHSRQKGINVYVTPKLDKCELDESNIYSSNLCNMGIKIGEQPPVSDDVKSNEEVYYEKYLRDHSLGKTRFIHTLATVFGVASAAYGIFNQNWRFVAGGIGGIYACGFLSHLIVEKNIPSSTTFPLASVYGDLRITMQTLLNPLTGGMDKDLKIAGIATLP